MEILDLMLINTTLLLTVLIGLFLVLLFKGSKTTRKVSKDIQKIKEQIKNGED